MLVVGAADSIAGDRALGVERHLAHTVDGVVGVVHNLRHTVLCSLHHHTTAPDATEVSALDGVHDTSGIARDDTVLLPVGLIDGTIGVDDVRITSKERNQFVVGNGRAYGIVCALVVGTLLLTLVLQFVIGRLTVGQCMIFVDTDIFGDMVVVRAIVRDVQATVAVDERQVTITVEAARMTRTDRDEVTVVDIVDGCRGIAEDGGGISIHLVTTRRHVTTGEHGVVDDDTIGVETVPRCCSRGLVLKGVQCRGGYVVTCFIKSTVNRYGCLYFAMRLNQHVAVLRHVFLCAFTQDVAVVIRIEGAVGLIVIALAGIIVSIAPFLAEAQFTLSVDIGTVDIADITATEHVAVAFGDATLCADLTAIDPDIGLSEDIAVGIERTRAAQVVDTLTTGEHIAQDMTIVDVDVCLTCLVDTPQGAQWVLVVLAVYVAATDGCNLAATEDRVTDKAVVDLDIGDVDTTVVDIAATEDITTRLQVGVGNVVAMFVHPGLVDNLLLIALVDDRLRIISAFGVIHIADVAVVERDVGRAKDGTTLATGVGITLDGRYTIGKGVAIGGSDDDMRLTVDVVGRRSADVACMEPHATFPAATIDVSGDTALDIDIGTGREATGVGRTIRTGPKWIVDTSGRSGSIDILAHRTAKQGKIGGAIDATTHRLGTIAIAATIGISADGSPFVNDYVGIIFILPFGLFLIGVGRIIAVVHLCLPYKRVVQIGIVVVIVSVEGIGWRVVIA